MTQTDTKYAEILHKVELTHKMVFHLYQNLNPLKDWLNRKNLKMLFDYSDSQIRELEKKSSIKVSKVGRRRFYSVASILKIIESGVVNKAN
jgi:hypothetical protein